MPFTAQWPLTDRRLTPRASSGLLLVMIWMALVWPLALAQNPDDSVQADAEVVAQVEDAPLGLFAVGFTAGFPSYQTVALTASLQARYVGLQLKGSITPVGPYFGVQLRGYPPIPVPLPIYVGVGAGVYGSNVSYLGVIGTHVPLGKALRLDVEGGVANLPLLGERTWAPHLAVGLSYAFPVDLSAGPGQGEAEGGNESAVMASGACPVPTEPDKDQIGDVIARIVKDWIDSARASYGSVYTGLSYSYRIASSRVSGNTASVSVSYRGSVQEILTGKRHHASGTASATLKWDGCGWSATSVKY